MTDVEQPKRQSFAEHYAENKAELDAVAKKLRGNAMINQIGSVAGFIDSQLGMQSFGHWNPEIALRLKCLEMAGFDLAKARDFYEFVVGNASVPQAPYEVGPANTGPVMADRDGPEIEVQEAPVVIRFEDKPEEPTGDPLQDAVNALDPVETERDLAELASKVPAHHTDDTWEPLKPATAEESAVLYIPPPPSEEAPMIWTPEHGWRFEKEIKAAEEAKAAQGVEQKQETNAA